MNAHALLSDLADRGITLEARGDRLRASPRSKLPPGLLARIAEHKAALLQLLAPEPVDADCADSGGAGIEGS